MTIFNRIEILFKSAPKKVSLVYKIEINLFLAAAKLQDVCRQAYLTDVQYMKTLH
jgi:hypothetical protein